jgi:hypothetical protein
MVDIVTLHLNDKDEYVLTIFHDIAILSYSVENNCELVINYIHKHSEVNCGENEQDYETFIWSDDGKVIADEIERYSGISVDNEWFPIGDSSIEEYLNRIRLYLNKEIVETDLEEIEKN